MTSGKAKMHIDEYEYLIRTEGFQAASDKLYEDHHDRAPQPSIRMWDGRMTIFPHQTLSIARHPLDFEGAASSLKLAAWANSHEYRSFVLLYYHDSREVLGYYEFHHAKHDSIAHVVKKRMASVDEVMHALIGSDTPYPRRFFEAMDEDETFGFRYADWVREDYRRAALSG